LSGLFFTYISTMKLEIDEKIYCLEAVQKAAYRFIDRLTILITNADGKLVCEIEAVEGAEAQIDRNIANFKRELLDQQLRKKIKEETEPARNLILAYAFSRSGLQG
jgi:His-Xaa-Ser system protein HxsD